MSTPKIKLKRREITGNEPLAERRAKEWQNFVAGLLETELSEILAAVATVIAEQEQRILALEWAVLMIPTQALRRARRGARTPLGRVGATAAASTAPRGPTPGVNCPTAHQQARGSGGRP